MSEGTRLGSLTIFGDTGGDVVAASPIADPGTVNGFVT